MSSLLYKISESIFGRNGKYKGNKINEDDEGPNKNTFNNIIGQLLENSVQISSALTSEAIDFVKKRLLYYKNIINNKDNKYKTKDINYAREKRIKLIKNLNTYPFAQINGAGFKLGNSAVKGHVKGFFRKALSTFSIPLNIQQKYKITHNDIIFHPNTYFIGTSTNASTKGHAAILDSPENYILAPEHLLKFQALRYNDDTKKLELSEDEPIVFTPNSKSKDNTYCILRKITAQDIQTICNLKTANDCINFIDSISSMINKFAHTATATLINHVGLNKSSVLAQNYTGKYVITNCGNTTNPNYGNCIGYFKNKECYDENTKTINISKYKELIKNGVITVEEFYTKFVFNIFLCSDPKHTFVWNKIYNTSNNEYKNAIDKYNAIYNQKYKIENNNDDKIITKLTIDGEIEATNLNQLLLRALIQNWLNDKKEVLPCKFFKDQQLQTLLTGEDTKKTYTGYTRDFIKITSKEDGANIKDADGEPMFDFLSKINDSKKIIYGEQLTEDKLNSLKKVLKSPCYKSLTAKRFIGEYFSYRTNDKYEADYYKPRTRINNNDLYKDYEKETPIAHVKFNIILMRKKDEKKVSGKDSFGLDENNYFIFNGYENIITGKASTSDLASVAYNDLTFSNTNGVNSVSAYNKKRNITMNNIDTKTKILNSHTKTDTTQNKNIDTNDANTKQIDNNDKI